MVKSQDAVIALQLGHHHAEIGAAADQLASFELLVDLFPVVALQQIVDVCEALLEATPAAHKSKANTLIATDGLLHGDVQSGNNLNVIIAG